ncbi:MAG: tRNA preQ1(34) S-adenosylmethionine ribosyltransferase-isomerase QueA [Rhodospirillales bacterium]
MDIHDFDFALPADRIAQRPVRPRDAARLLVVDEKLRDCRVRDLPALLRPGDLLVVNDTKVLPTRLHGRRGAVVVEATLIEPLGRGRWRALAKPGRRLRAGDRIDFALGLSGQVEQKDTNGAVVLDFGTDNGALARALDEHGAAPLPPYIRRDAPDPQDRADYQTVYAADPGAIAAPTAGLHFTAELLQALAAAGVARTAVTLHVGAGTFLPVTAARLEDHVMHAEGGMIGDAAAAAIAAARARGGRIIAVGTTTLRLLETAADDDGQVRPWSGETRLFVTPGFRFRAVDLLITNFHLPRSTLFMLVCAFAGISRMQAAYGHAIAHGYRFYSYGDACLLSPLATR